MSHLFTCLVYNTCSKINANFNLTLKGHQAPTFSLNRLDCIYQCSNPLIAIVMLYCAVQSDMERIKADQAANGGCLTKALIAMDKKRHAAVKKRLQD